MPNWKNRPPSAGLDLRSYDGLIRGGTHGEVIVPGNGKGSLIVKRIDGGGMPSIEVRWQLTTEEIQLFIDWIDEGAKDN